ncbi:MAG: class I SAM-dependent methyltransferase [Elusimicrobiota bacterium]
MTDYLKEHLNVWWLRPEQAVWDARASEIAEPFAFKSPSLDLGCGNGLYSFISAGGRLNESYDWFIHARSSGFSRNSDSFDMPLRFDPSRAILRRPRARIDFAFDHKPNLLAQAGRLGLYKNLKQGDANARLPFQEGELSTVYSNILYWLRDPRARFQDISRVLRAGGRAILSLQDPSFKTICESYQWRAKRSELLRMLNRGRAECSHWTATLSDIKAFGRDAGLRLVHSRRYLSARTLRFWDVGLRPLFPPLLEMTRRLRPKDRQEVKSLWMETALPLLREMLELERREGDRGGYHFVVLEKY